MFFFNKNLIMSSYVSASTIVRLCFILVLLLLNFVTFIKLTFFVKQKPVKKYFCVHRVSTIIILIANIIYLLTWLPYFVFLFDHLKWLILNPYQNCMLQYFITSQEVKVLLVVSTVRHLYDSLTQRCAKIWSWSLIVVWVLPQLMYISIIEMFNSEKVNYQVIDGWFLIPHIRTKVANINVGFKLCVLNPLSPVINHLSQHYMSLIIPLSAVIFSCLLISFLQKRSLYIQRKFN